MTPTEARRLLPMTVIKDNDHPDKLGTVVYLNKLFLKINWDDGTSELMSYDYAQGISIK